MLKVQIKNKANEVTHEGQFASQPEIDAWIVQCEAVQAWGKPERWVTDSLLAPLSVEEKATALESRSVEVMGEVVTEYRLPAEYSIEVVDATAQVAEEKAISKYLARIQFGQKLMAELAAKNSAALLNGTLTTAEILQYKTELAPVKDFLLEGSIGFAVQALSAAQNLPVDLKNEFVLKMQNYLASEV